MFSEAKLFRATAFCYVQSGGGERNVKHQLALLSLFAATLGLAGPSLAQQVPGLVKAPLTPTFEDCQRLGKELTEVEALYRHAFQTCKDLTPIGNARSTVANGCGRSAGPIHPNCVASGVRALCAYEHWLQETTVCRRRAQSVEQVRRAAESEAQRLAREKADQEAPGVTGLYDNYKDFRNKLEQGQLIGENIETMGNKEAQWSKRTNSVIELGSQASDFALRRNQLSRDLMEDNLRRLQDIVNNAQNDFDAAMDEFDQSMSGTGRNSDAAGYEAEFARIREQIRSGGAQSDTDQAFDDLKRLLEQTASERRANNAEVMAAARRIAEQQRRTQAAERRASNAARRSNQQPRAGTQAQPNRTTRKTQSSGGDVCANLRSKFERRASICATEYCRMTELAGKHGCWAKWNRLNPPRSYPACGGSGIQFC